MLENVFRNADERSVLCWWHSCRIRWSSFINKYTPAFVYTIALVNSKLLWFQLRDKDFTNTRYIIGLCVSCTGYSPYLAAAFFRARIISFDLYHNVAATLTTVIFANFNLWIVCHIFSRLLSTVSSLSLTWAVMTVSKGQAIDYGLYSWQRGAGPWVKLSMRAPP
jgi:hypothetical protein